ncbi:MAG: hypothetical protein WAO71_13415 [Gallionella sp.]
MRFSGSINWIPANANRRKQFKLTVPEKLFDAIEAEWADRHAPNGG